MQFQHVPILPTETWEKYSESFRVSIILGQYPYVFFLMGVYYTIKIFTEVCGQSAVVSISPSMLQNKSTNLQNPRQTSHSVKLHHHFAIILGDVACGENQGHSPFV